MAGANPKNHISFSELMNWALCPYYHKLVNIDDKLPFKGSEFTCLGSAVHHAIEKMVEKEAEDPNYKHNQEWAVKLFDEKFMEELKTFWEDNKKHDPNYEKRVDLVMDLRKAGHECAKHALPALRKYLGGYELIKAEHQLYVPIDGEIGGQEYSFKGFIDLVVKDRDGIVHLIDWKTCSWGWESKKKSSVRTTYQLTYYKHFYAKEFGIDPDKIKCHFGLLKRTPAKNQPYVELFEVPIGKRKIKNALTLMNQALRAIHRGFFMHNWGGCQHPDRYGTCPFANTEHCIKRL